MTDFRHRTSLPVRFRDIDAFGHVNNAVFFSYVEQARIRYFFDVIGIAAIGPEGMPLILARVELDYRAPIFLEDTIEIGTRVDWLGNSSFGMSHQLVATGERLVADCQTVLVAYDYEQARPMPLREEWRAAVTAHEGRPLERPSRTDTSRPPAVGSPS